MCGRYVLVDKIEIIERSFKARYLGDYKPNYNISPGQTSLVLTDENPREIQLSQFGYSPSWAKKQMYLFNARAEGDSNKTDDPNFNGSKGIIIKPAFQKAIRSQRCLVIASAFIEGTTKEKLNKPYLVYLNSRPFAFAGIWNIWNGIHTFAIITTTPNELIQKSHTTGCR